MILLNLQPTHLAAILQVLTPFQLMSPSPTLPSLPVNLNPPLSNPIVNFRLHLSTPLDYLGPPLLNLREVRLLPSPIQCVILRDLLPLATLIFQALHQFGPM